jgi:hypothetical protein
MNRPFKRVCIYPKDIQLITGRSNRQSSRLLNDIRKSLNKPKKSLVSIQEFCEYTGLKFEQVEAYIVG